MATIEIQCLPGDCYRLSSRAYALFTGQATSRYDDSDSSADTQKLVAGTREVAARVARFLRTSSLPADGLVVRTSWPRAERASLTPLSVEVLTPRGLPSAAKTTVRKFLDSMGQRFPATGAPVTFSLR